METILNNAAATGDEKALHKLLENDPFLLDRVSYTSSNNTPLHIATMKGRVPFVHVILNHNPQLAEELNSQHSSPLHIASAKGHVEIARKLLEAAPDMCLTRDCQGRNPLHLAVMKGHVEVLRELVQRAPVAAREKVDRGLTLLHLCVKHGNLEALRILVQELNELVNIKNDDGDTTLHMAVMANQVEIIQYLVGSTEIDVNIKNSDGQSAVTILQQSPRHKTNSFINKFIKRGSWERLLEQQDNWLKKKKSALMVVASLIATMAFQVGVNPPSGVWQDDKSDDSQGNKVKDSHVAGYSVMAHNYPEAYKRFNIVNTTGFIASLSIILLLMSGLPIRRRFFMWILMVVTWIAITAIAFSYLFAIAALTPSKEENSVAKLIGFAIIAWLLLMALLLIGHTIRLIVKMFRKLITILLARRRRRNTVPGSAILGNNSSIAP